MQSHPDHSEPTAITESRLPITVGWMQHALEYQELMMIYQAGIQHVTTKLDIFNQEFSCRNDRNPIESISSRVKTPQSVFEKLEKKGLAPTLENMRMQIHDIAGVRVICPFILDVYQVAELLIHQPDIHLVQSKDYIQQPKENGYRSLHLLIHADVCFSQRQRMVPIEIQLRTVAMNFWASTEHQLRYKKNKAITLEEQEELRQCASTIAQTDLRMQRLAEGLLDFAKP